MWEARDMCHDNFGLQKPSTDGATHALEYARILFKKNHGSLFLFLIDRYTWLGCID